MAILRTAKGREYHNVVVRKIEPIGLRIFHESGATLIPPEEIPQYAAQFASPEALGEIRARLKEQDDLWHETQGRALQQIAGAEAAREENRVQNVQAQSLAAKEPSSDKAETTSKITRVRMLARTVAMRRKETKSAYYWTSGSSLEQEFIFGGTKQIFRHRVVGIDISNTGTNPELVVEVFWLGAPFKGADTLRGSTRINAYSANVVKVKPGDRITLHVASDYQNFDSELTYLRQDPRGGDTLRGFYVRSWGGYDYKGWVVRISDGRGKIVAAQGSRLPQIEFTSDFPAPCLK